MLLSIRKRSWLMLLMFVCVSSESGQEVNCVFHAKKRLICDVTIPDVTTSVDYNCSICPHFKIAKKVISCPDGFPAPECPVYRGRCEYNCRKLHLCNEGHAVMVTYKGDHSNEPTSFCRYVATNQLVKPGPVNDLTLTLHGGKVKVTWTKPSDLRNDDVMYRYMVECGSNQTVETFKSRKDKLKAFCALVETDSTSLLVSVRSHPHHQGYWSEPRTAVLPGREIGGLVITPSLLVENIGMLRESEGDQKIYVDEATIKPLLLAVLGMLCLLCLLICVATGWIVWNYALCPSKLSESDLRAICRQHNVIADDFNIVTVRPACIRSSTKETPFRKITV